MPEAVSATSPGPAPTPARVWARVGPLELTTGRLIGALVVLVALVALALFWQRIDVDALHARAQALPAWGVIAVICGAPLVGVPVAMLHVVAGVRFGPWVGLLVVLGATVLQHVMGYALVKLAPSVFARRLASWRQRFPRGAHRPMTVFSCLLPGMPYAVQLYLLPVLGVPLSVLLTVSVPLHVLRSIISILGGDWSKDLTPAKVMILVAYYLVLTGICALLFRRIRRELRSNQRG
ncbi:MAG TPA: hypothetical protein VHF69_13665 [Candidatus Synoicihabitans sp.]|nr:hypothetical protein [Candidatus Synoicihabitans sp.]